MRGLDLIRLQGAVDRKTQGLVPSKARKGSWVLRVASDLEVDSA